MKQVLVFGLLAVLAASFGWTQVPSPAEQELVKLERAWADALVKRDVAVVQQIYADEYVDTDPDGVVTNKAQDLANLTSGALKLAAQTLADLKVHVYGDVGVVHGSYTQKGTLQGKDVSGTFRFTDVFVKRSGRWQCVSTQSTRVAKK